MSELIEALLSGVIFESQVTSKHYRILARYDKRVMADVAKEK